MINTSASILIRSKRNDAFEIHWEWCEGQRVCSSGIMIQPVSYTLRPRDYHQAMLFHLHFRGQRSSSSMLRKRSYSKTVRAGKTRTGAVDGWPKDRVCDGYTVTATTWHNLPGSSGWRWHSGFGALYFLVFHAPWCKFLHANVHWKGLMQVWGRLVLMERQPPGARWPCISLSWMYTNVWSVWSNDIFEASSGSWSIQGDKRLESSFEWLRTIESLGTRTEPSYYRFPRNPGIQKQ